MKKILVLTLSVMMCISLVLSGCGGGKNTADQTAGQDKLAETTAQKPDSSSSGSALPITKEKTDLTFVVRQTTDVENLETNEFTKWAEQQTNIHINWELIPSDSFKDKFNLLLASGSYPDVFFGCNTDNNTMADLEMKYGVREGVFIPLNDLIEKYGVETKRILSSVDFLKDFASAPDGKIYGLPTYSNIQHVEYGQKLWINKPWLDKLNLKMPVTTEEFYEALKAFKTKDPNGNGIQDEVPLAGCLENWFTEVYPFLVNAFILDEGMYSEHLMINNGKIDTILDKPEYKEALKYINRLYKEGLIYEGSFTQKTDQFKQIAENKDAELLGAGAGGGAIMFLSSNNSPRYKSFVTVPPLKGPNGVQQTPHYIYSSVRLGAYYITKSCKNPDVAFKLADFYYSKDASMRLRLGVKDKNWRDAKPDEKGVDGRPATYAEIEVSYTGGVQNDHYGNTGLFFETNDMWTMERAFDQSLDILDPKAMQQYLQVETTKNYVPYGANYSVPPARYLPEEQSEASLLKTEIMKYTDESRIRFITGDMDVEKDWDKYIQNLEKLNMKRYLELYQNAYDRQYGN